MNARLGAALHPYSLLAIAFLTCIAAACATTEAPVVAEMHEQEVVPARMAGESQRLVLLLRSTSESPRWIKQSGLIEAIQRGIPDADVQLAHTTLPLFISSDFAHRLHNAEIRSAYRRGYREIYLAGAGKGGTAALLYERAYPEEVQGLILMSPYMGGDMLIREIEQTGRIANWEPGPLPQTIDGYTAPRELWRMVKAWVNEPERTRNVWLVYGRDDEFGRVAKLLSAVLPNRNMIDVRAEDARNVWKRGASEAFAKIYEAPPEPRLAR